MDPFLAIIVAVAALAIGLAFGWTFASKALPPLREEVAAAKAEVERARAETGAARSETAAARAATEEWRTKFNEAIVNLAAERKTAERVEAAEQALNDERARASALAARVAGFERAEEERQRNHEAQVADLKELAARMEARFGELAGKAVEGAHDLFLKRAEQRLGQAGEKSEEKLKALLSPVEQSLKQHREMIDRVEAARAEAFGSLTGVIGEMKAGQEAVRSEAAKLVNSLRSAPKARGRWGEQQLRNVLETCGLSDYCDFQMEVSVEAEEGRLRPDAIIRVPGGKALVVDAKVSLNAYQDAFAAVDDQARHAGLAGHAAAMKAHVNGLGNKAYWSQFADAPDYVIMFVPGEHFLSAALEHDPTLWDFAFEKRVLLATPTNLIAIARTVAAVWRQEKLADEAKKIGALGKEMYDRLAVATGKLKTMGSGLNTAVKNYNDFVSSFEGRVLVTGRRFKELNIETGARDIEDIQPLDALPRYSEPDPTLIVAQLPDAEAAE